MFARFNPPPPRQDELHHKLVVKLGQKCSGKKESCDVFLFTYMEDLKFTNDGSIPMNIERGIIELEDRGVHSVFPVMVEAHTKKGTARFTPVPVNTPPDHTKELQDFPFLAHIDVYNWPSDQAKRELLHELDHMTQWIGTGLIRVAEGEMIRDAFQFDLGFSLYGLPKKKYRTYQEVPDVLPAGQRAHLRHELSYDEEFYPYVHDIAAEIQRLGQDPEEYFEDLSDMLDRRPGSRERWEELKHQVYRLLGRPDLIRRR